MTEEVRDLDTMDWDLTVPDAITEVVRGYLADQLSPEALASLAPMIAEEAYNAALRIRQALGLGEG